MSLNAMPNGPLGLSVEPWSHADLVAGAAAGAAGMGVFGKWIGSLWRGRASKRRKDELERQLLSERLRAWEDSLQRREKEYRTEIEDRLKAVTIRTEQQDVLIDRLTVRFRAARGSLQEVTIELRHLRPDSEAVKRAEALLKDAFRPEWNTPDDMVEAIKGFDQPAA